MLEAKAEENARAASGAATAEANADEVVSSDTAAAPEAAEQTLDPVTPQDATKIQEPIPLPAPPNAGPAEGTNAADATGEPLASPAAAVEVNDTTEHTKTETSTSEWWTYRHYRATVSKQLRKLTKFKWLEMEGTIKKRMGGVIKATWVLNNCGRHDYIEFNVNVNWRCM